MRVLLFAAVAPVAFLCSYIYKKDVNKEPSSLLSKIFIYGFFSAIPVIFLELFLSQYFPTEEQNSFIALFINVFVSVALVEEGFKWIVVRTIGFNNEEFDEVYDIIVYSVFSSLGFACIENIGYVFSSGIVNAIFRAFTSIPGHMCFGVVMGTFFSKAKVNQINGNRAIYVRNIFLSLFVPTLLHTVYDALWMYNKVIEFFIFYVIMVIICFKTVNHVSKMENNLKTGLNNGSVVQNSDGYIHYEDSHKLETNYCPICGKFVRGASYCPYCGFHLE